MNCSKKREKNREREKRKKKGRDSVEKRRYWMLRRERRRVLAGDA